MVKKIIAIWFQVGESFIASVESIKNNKTRTSLTLLGITVGIVSIISAYTVVDSLKSMVVEQFSSMGSNLLSVIKTGMITTNETWAEYSARPRIKREEYIKLKRAIPDKILYSAFFDRTSIMVKRSNNYIRAGVVGFVDDYFEIHNVPLDTGRYISSSEVIHGSRVAIIGSKVGESLFPNEVAIGKKISVRGIKFTVIGVMTKSGNEALGSSGRDGEIYTPYGAVRSMMSNRSFAASMVFKPLEGIHSSEVRESVRNKLRSIRRISPSGKDNFGLMETDQINQITDQVFSGISLAGTVIGLFSIVIGAIGVANIMFVSVKERTNLIGIQKALGAKGYAILLSYMFESVFLSFLGGIIGLIIVAILTWVANMFSPIEIILTFKNLSIGVLISVLVGVVAGYMPAKKAADLDPIKAIYNNY